MILNRTLPAGAVLAMLFRSGEYSIRGTFDLIGQSSLYWFADASDDGSRQDVDSSLMPVIPAPAMEVYG
jgi:hypothetical protein